VDQIAEGSEFFVGGKELQIDHSIKASEYYAGTCFTSGVIVSTSESAETSVLRNSSTAVKQFTPLRPNNGLPATGSSGIRAGVVSTSRKIVTKKPAEEASIDATTNDSAQTSDTFWMVNWYALNYIPEHVSNRHQAKTTTAKTQDMGRRRVSDTQSQ
jgi:DNA repair and recombination protein RAD54B